MLTTIIRWFHAPVFPEDEEKTRNALLLNVVLNIFLLALPIIFISILFVNTLPVLQHRTILAIIALSELAIPVLRRMMKTGQVQRAGNAFVFIIYVATTLTICNIGTLRTPAVSFFFVAIVVAGLTISRRAVIWMAGITSITIVMLLFAEINGLMPQSHLTASAAQGIAFIVVIGMISELLFLAVRNVDEALVRVRQELAERIRAREREKSRREMMEKVIRIGKNVTRQTADLRAALFTIWGSVRNGLDFDRTATFLYNPDDKTMQGSYGTDRSGKMSEEWGMRFMITEPVFFTTVLSQPDGFYFTEDYETERGLLSRPGHPMKGVKHYAAVACWSGDKPVAIICVDQLISGRAITEEQLEALRLFAGYAALAIENARLNSEIEARAQEREKFIQELGNRNAELERFTYTVSHDLRSPLVTIQGFLGMLDKDILQDKREKIASDMQRIAGAADKMNALLSDLLKLSRVGRIVNPPEEVDLVQLVQETQETLYGPIQSRQVNVITAENLPVVYGDRIRLREVFENLIGNAIKYMGDQISPTIEIGVRPQNGEQVIFVKDNGIGIEEQYHTKIFGLFEKLDPAIEGTGIGLALVKSIVETHGGKIWVESDGLGKGSMFCFTIPDSRAEENG